MHLLLFHGATRKFLNALNNIYFLKILHSKNKINRFSQIYFSLADAPDFLQKINLCSNIITQNVDYMNGPLNKCY